MGEGGGGMGGRDEEEGTTGDRKVEHKDGERGGRMKWVMVGGGWEEETRKRGQQETGRWNIKTEKEEEE